MTTFCVQATKAWFKSSGFFGVLLLAIAFNSTTFGQANTTRDAALERVTADIKYLASDELGGRQPGTPGMELTEKHIVDVYKEIGLEPISEEAGYLQSFNVGGTRTLEKEGAALVITQDGNEIPFLLDEDFKPQLSRGNVDITGDLVFVGYGIRSEDNNYDEYADVDVEGKIVVMLRMEPQQNDEDSVFDGVENSRNAFIRTKVSVARRAGAAGILLVNDGQTAPSAEKDELADYDQFGTQRIPFAMISRKSFDAIFCKSNLIKGDGTKFSSLADAEADIDRNLEPISQVLKNCTCKFTASFAEAGVTANNLVGIIKGEGPHADEVIVIGGHHDHLGMGAYGSRAGRREIHNGADDNATGTAAVMELARRFAAQEKKPARTLVFVCFSAEEMGLLGARHYVDNPIMPLEKTVAMINFDMIGWLRNKKVTVFNWNSSPAFGPVLEEANKGFELNLELPASGFAGSDHLPFYQRQVPVMFFHTGLTDTYHTPEDDFETIDCDGALTVIEYTEKVVQGIANLEEGPTFEGPGAGRRERRAAPEGRARPERRGEPAENQPQRVRLGTILDEDWDDDLEAEVGVKVASVLDDFPAKVAGIQEGDIITHIDGEKVMTRRAIVLKVGANAGKTVKIKFLRGEEENVVDVELRNE